MEVLFLIGSVQAVFLAILLSNKKGKSSADYLLGIWLFFMGIHLLYYYLLSTGFLYEHPRFLGIGIAFPQLEAPFMFIYVLLIIGKGKFRSAYFLHALPFIFSTIYLCFDFYFLNASEKINYYNQMNEDIPLDLYILSLPNIIMGPVYVVWSLIKLARHSKNINQQFSYTQKINLNWLKFVIGGLGFVYFVVIASNILVKYPFLSERTHENLIYLAVTISVFFLGYFGIKQQAIYRVAPIETRKIATPSFHNKRGEINQYKNSGLKKEEAEQHLKTLLLYFEEKKPYLNGKLSLGEVAAYLRISVNHLSQVINEQTGKSFFDFVNEYRIEEVKSRLANHSHQNFTLLAIAFDSGFNSKSSFNHIFKKFTGETPSQYANRLSA